MLENPWPAAIVLALLGGLLIWRALADGRQRILAAGAAAWAVAIVLLVVGWAVTTSGEHARSTVQRLIVAVVDADVATASGLFEPEATINFDRPENPSLPRSVIDRGLDSLAGLNRIESHSTTLLKGYSLDGDTGIVHLGCWTQTASSMGTVPSQWVLRVRRQPDGSWRIARLTCVSIAGRQVGSAVW